MELQTTSWWTLMKNHKDLWIRYWKKRSVVNRNALVTAYLPSASRQLQNIVRSLPSRITFDELIGAACEGLIKAIESYDSSKAGFMTYASRRVFGCIMDSLRGMDEKARVTRLFERKRQKALQFLSHGHSPSEEEIAEHLQMDWLLYCKRLNRSQQIIHGFPVDDDLEEIGIIDKKARNPEDLVHYQILLEDVLRGGNHNDQVVLKSYFHDGLTCIVIGEALHLSESRISQIKNDAIARFKHVA